MICDFLILQYTENPWKTGKIKNYASPSSKMDVLVFFMQDHVFF